MFPAILFVCLFNGLFSPLHQLVAQLVLINVVALPGLASGAAGSFLLSVVVPHAASLIIAFGTMFVSGVPAALYERMTRRQSDQTAMMIWMAGTLFLSLPAIQAFL